MVGRRKVPFPGLESEVYPAPMAEHIAGHLFAGATMSSQVRPQIETQPGDQHYSDCWRCSGRGNLLRCQQCPNVIHKACMRLPFDKDDVKCHYCVTREAIGGSHLLQS